MSGYELGAYDDPAELIDADDGSDWEQWAEEFEAEPGQPAPSVGLDPTLYPDEPVGPVDQQFGEDLRRQAAGEAFREDLASFVREQAAGMEIRADEQVVGRVTQELMAARDTVFRGWLQQGATVGQAAQALGDLDFQAAAEVALQQERQRAAMDKDSSLRQWRAGRAEQTRLDQAAGREPRADVMNEPYIETMRRRLEAFAEGQKQWAEGIEAAYFRQTGQR